MRWTVPIDSTGAPNGITATATRHTYLRSNGSEYYTGGFNDNGQCCETDGDRLLMRFGMDMGDTHENAGQGLVLGPAVTVEVENIPYQTYDVLVYLTGKEGGVALVDFTANGGAFHEIKTLRELDPANNVPNPEGGINYVESDSTAILGSTQYQNADPGHYVRFYNVSGPSFEFSVSTSWRTQLAGFQIINTSAAAAIPEPAAGLLALFGFTAMMTRRRRA